MSTPVNPLYKIVVQFVKSTYKQHPHEWFVETSPVLTFPTYPYKEEIESRLRSVTNGTPDWYAITSFEVEEDDRRGRRVWNMLHAKAEEIGWPNHYRPDLTVIDFDYLTGAFAPKQDAPKGSFLWILRDCGTHILDPEDPHQMRSVEWHLKNSADPECNRWFTCHGGDALKEVTPTHAAQWFKEAYLDSREEQRRREKALA